MQIGLFSAAGGVTIPSGIDVVTTTGFQTVGKGIARYRRMAAAPAASDSWGAGFWYFQSADGAYWELCEPRPTSDMFGTVGDAARISAASPATGTDVTDIINKALWYCYKKALKVLILSRGHHLTSDTIHIGLGEDYSSIGLHGEIERPGDADTSFPLAAIYTDRNDRPCINVQGARHSEVYDVVCYGPIEGYIDAHGLGNGANPAYPTIRDTRIRDWNPGDGTTDGQYNPGVAFAMDAYAGDQPGTAGIAPDWTGSTRYLVGDGRTNAGNLYQCVVAGTSGATGGPSATGSGDIADGTVIWAYIGPDTTLISYPAPSHPAYTGVAGGWGKARSSDVTFRNCHAVGFACGYISHPSGSDGNGDYLRLQNCGASYTTICLSICNSQSRAVEVSNFNQVFSHTVFTNCDHGARVGKFGGHITNFEGGHWLRLFNYSAAAGGNLAFRNGHWEACWRLGDAVGHGSDIIFEGCDMDMGDQNATGSVRRGLPINMIGRTNGSGEMINVGVVMRDCILQAPQLFALYSARVRVEAGYMFARARDWATVPAYVAQAHNALNGGVFVPTREDVIDASVSAAFYRLDVDTGTAFDVTCPWDGSKWRAWRNFGTPIYARRLAYQNDYRNSVRNEMPGIVFDSGAFTNSLSGRVLTLNTGGGWQIHGDRWNLKPGDVFYHTGTGLVFFIFSFDGTEIKGVAMNGYRVESGAVTFPELGEPDFDSGQFIFYSGRRHVSRDNVTATLTSGSAVVTNVANGLGSSANLAVDFPAGDVLYVDEIDDNYIPPDNQVVTAGGATAPSFTLDQAALKSKTIRPIFRRTIPSIAAP